eukprot:scaffold9963_cov120-Skeletonema_marinoi.AAC.1
MSVEHVLLALGSKYEGIPISDQRADVHPCLKLKAGSQSKIKAVPFSFSHFPGGASPYISAVATFWI